jgi:hypothetical protein
VPGAAGGERRQTKDPQNMLMKIKAVRGISDDPTEISSHWI